MPAPCSRHVLPNANLDLTLRGSSSSRATWPRVDEGATQAVVEHQQRQHGHFAGSDLDVKQGSRRRRPPGRGRLRATRPSLSSMSVAAAGGDARKRQRDRSQMRTASARRQRSRDRRLPPRTSLDCSVSGRRASTSLSFQARKRSIEWLADSLQCRSGTIAPAVERDAAGRIVVAAHALTPPAGWAKTVAAPGESPGIDSMTLRNAVKTLLVLVLALPLVAAVLVWVVGPAAGDGRRGGGDRWSATWARRAR